MSLPTTFRFSQNNLQDYVDCPRRFELRHLLHLEWPALQSEPVLEREHQMELGQRFHRMVQQHLAGLPAPLLSTQAANDPDLARWWDNFLSSQILENLPPTRRAEYQISAPFSGFRLLAQYDLLAIQPGERAVILDWKTGAQKPNSAHLKLRVQTRLYPFLLCLAGQFKDAEKIEMIYWFSEHPQKPVRFKYSADQYAEDERYLRSLIVEIQSLGPTHFLLTPDERKCAYCNFRSLCQRGTKAGDTDAIPEDIEPSEDEPLALDFENIDPISF